MSTEKIRYQLLITGKVQGVCYRAYAQQKAIELGVNGFVRNKGDGSVEIIAEGNPGLIKQLITWSHTGPPYANVDQVKTISQPYTGEFSHFSIRY